MEKKLTIDVEALKKSLLQRRPMKARFKLPMSEDEAYAYLLAAMMAEVEYRHRRFNKNPELENQIAKAARWLTKQDRFGILLCGVPGNGKTTLMLAIRSLINYLDMKDAYNESMTVFRIDAREIARLNKDDFAKFEKIRSKKMLAIDDMGLEPAEVMDYGNILNPVVDLLSYRYDEQLFTIVTTNLKPEEIRQK